MNCRIISITILLSLCLLTAGAYAQKVELIFSHKLHTEDVEATCTDCHASADTSVLSSHNLLPDMETCYNCHDSDAECTVCHKDPDNAVPYPRITAYVAHFPHAKHTSQNLDCATCHSGVATSENIFDKHLPAMATCTYCHNDMEQADYCYVCHTTREDLTPKDHRLDWVKAHGVASQTSDDCKMCHVDNQCLDCHQQDNLDHKVHPLNFRHNHSLWAKGNKDNCYTCHEELSYCVDCHRAEFVMPRTHAVAAWSNTVTGGNHARAAQQDLDSCISCHSDTAGDPICVQCHQDK